MKRKSAPDAATASITAVPPRRTAAGRSALRAPHPDRGLAILLAAEKLFALRGYHGVSIRDIATEAGVPLALVGYYYGAKHELHRAIFESWQSSIDQRLAGLRAAAADPRASDALECMIDAFVSPVIALQNSPEGQYFPMMAARDLAAPSEEATRAQGEFFDPLAQAFIDALMVVFPGVDRGRVAWCYHFMLGAMQHFLLNGERVRRLSKGEGRTGDPAAKDLLLRYIAAGLRGALSASASKRPSRKQA